MSEPSGFPPYEPDGLPASRPPRPAAVGHRVGRAEGVATRVESQGTERSSETILAFRLVDPASGRPVEVELRGRSLAGTVRDGDWIEAAGEPGRSGRLELARVTNLTTSSEVTAVGSSATAGAKVFKIVFLIIFVAILLAVVGVAIWMFQQPF
ncbi:hypothetical protein [uncultured Friedmanniella sp.]|uniref:hypothetical protein n=1 Tax=uncultured Friedmanniella sp. TaxID=335381 RepID=UPI0035CBFEB8